MKKFEAHILVVDDDSSTRTILRKMLIKDGWRVDEAENGKLALNRMNQEGPELILLDLLMPVMDGFTFLKEIKIFMNGHSLSQVLWGPSESRIK